MNLYNFSFYNHLFFIKQLWLIEIRWWLNSSNFLFRYRFRNAYKWLSLMVTPNLLRLCLIRLGLVIRPFSTRSIIWRFTSSERGLRDRSLRIVIDVGSLVRRLLVIWCLCVPKTCLSIRPSRRWKRYISAAHCFDLLQ